MAINKFLVQGRMVRDVELRKTETNNKNYVFLTIAVNDWNGKEKVTHWLDFVAYGKVAELISKYFKKGSEILLECKATSTPIEDSNGYTKNFVLFVVESVHFTATPKEEKQEKETNYEELIEIDEDRPF